jgi:lipoprotein-anchoring transpeptidase ErfK/SrfK
MPSLMRRAGFLAVAMAVAFLALATACGPSAAATDPAQAAAARQARDTASRSAWDAFTRLQAARGGSDWAPYLRQFSSASDAAAFERLASDWSIEARAAELARQFLVAQGGGEHNGQLNDVVTGVEQMEAGVQRALAADVAIFPADETRAWATVYPSLDVDLRVEQHNALVESLQQVAAVLNWRADAKAHVRGLAAGLDDLVATAQTVGIPDTLPQQVADAKVAAAAARTDEELTAATAKVQATADLVNGIINRTESAPLPPCMPGGGAGQYIWIHLATQQLVAYQDGCPVMAMPVTTGRPALPTDRGTFRIFYKTPWYHMISPWPEGSGFYYPPTWVQYAMEFVGDGTFIHSADWQPDDSYGPGSQYGPYASHGCIHVQDGPLVKLYAWAQVGATVHVGD